MALQWKISGKSVDAVKSEIQSAISKISVPSVAQLSWQGNELCINIDKGGKSEFRIALENQGSDVCIKETKRSVALLHKPFVGKVEELVASVLSKVGAKS